MKKNNWSKAKITAFEKKLDITAALIKCMEEVAMLENKYNKDCKRILTLLEKEYNRAVKEYDRLVRKNA